MKTQNGMNTAYNDDVISAKKISIWNRFFFMFFAVLPQQQRLNGTNWSSFAVLHYVLRPGKARSCPRTAPVLEWVALDTLFYMKMTKAPASRELFRRAPSESAACDGMRHRNSLKMRQGVARHIRFHFVSFRFSYNSKHTERDICRHIIYNQRDHWNWWRV